MAAKTPDRLVGASPCGFATEILRSCYSTRARLTNDPTHISDLLWYFTDNPFVPFPTLWFSRNWSDRRIADSPTLVGEVPGAPRTWRNGADPATSPLLDCTQPWGLREWFRSGAPLLPEPAPVDSNGWPLCCNACCAVQWDPLEFTTVLSGFGDDPSGIRFSDLNGAWLLTLADGTPDGCQWSSGPTPPYVSLYLPGDPGTIAAFVQLDVENGYVYQSPYDLGDLFRGPVTLGLWEDFYPDAIKPASITLTPGRYCKPPPAAPPDAWTDHGGEPITDEGGAPLQIQG